ncbi:hypothetical protein AVEN_42909-1 [Araneus ventricosus]|uniref:Reverse transcriptase domain-containing protein n=1 Tax=Araneus ventricosus TaxID=182803 RepID=A0A4Y2AEZ2_ARAVE|nr:hypothetical protein AVEN_42909-1 [Araneus ventricosus]
MWPVLPIRELDVKLTRLRIGHTCFTHKHLIFGKRTPVCPTCHTDFTTNHILIECPSFKSYPEGVPQGSVLSVTLFILHLSQILNHLPSSVHGSLYVDDLQISCQGSNMHLIERQLQNAVNKLLAWCDNNGHTISAEKSRCVHFCRKRNIHLDPNIRIRNSPIPIVNEIRFLGVIFDRKLTFLPHVLHLWEKCEKPLKILKVLSKTY